MPQNPDHSDTLQWGSNLTMLCYADRNYLPGAYGLFNSAIVNQFKGVFKLILDTGVDTSELPQHDQLQFIHLDEQADQYPKIVRRLFPLQALAEGDYLFLDCDIVFERPAGILFEALDDGPIFSSEPEPKYDAHDVRLYRQCKTLGLKTALEAFAYINCGLIAFRNPRDTLIPQWAQLCQKHLTEIDQVCGSEFELFPFPEQDILNCLAKQKGQNRYTISPRVLELGHHIHPNLFERPFPWTAQAECHPKDQLKFIIHGSSLRRPWLKESHARIPDMLIEQGGIHLARSLQKKITPYERAWAYYTCREDLPIPLSQWASQHDFTLYQTKAWQHAHGLTA